jgi:hypothetical protein
MAQKKSGVSAAKETPAAGMFSKENYKWMLAGVVIMAVGLFLMAGGKSNDPAVFNPKEVYSTTRITVAPILILAGIVIEIFAIFRKPKV